jgi:proline iminopeptidase
VQGLILRGIFLGRQSEIDWFMHGMGQFYPEEWQRFVSHSTGRAQDLLQAYYRRLCDPDPAVHLPGAQLGPLRGGMRGHPAESRGYYQS